MTTAARQALARISPLQRGILLNGTQTSPLSTSWRRGATRQASCPSRNLESRREISSSNAASFASSSRASQQHEESLSSNPANRPYARHRPTLPQPASYRLPIVLLIGFSLVSWGAFTLHTTNRERLSSSVLKNIVEKIKTSPTVAEAMGTDINLKRETWLAGDPYIKGNVNIVQGRVDLSFKVKGPKDSGQAYFSAIRREPGQPYETLRFLIVLDSTSETISLLDED